MTLLIEVQTMVLGESWFIRLDHWSWNDMKLNVSHLMVIGFHQITHIWYDITNNRDDATN